MSAGRPARLHRRFPALRGTLPHLRLGEGPTPVRETEAPGVWIKDDGRYGTVYGGNKVRKLEWLLADARRRGARRVVTVGGPGTNHGLATALYARRLDLPTERDAAGLALGLALSGLRTCVVGVVVADQLRLDAAAILRLAARAARLLRRRGAMPTPRAPEPERLLVTRDQLGAGYGHRTPASERAAGWARRHAALELDPVYTAKAMAGLLALRDGGRLGDQPVLFWQTRDRLSRPDGAG